MATILVIEDEEDIRLNLAELLTLAQHNVLTAANGKEGVELAQTGQPDLIISDITMPCIDGFGVLHILKKHSATKDIPFIFLTSKSEMGNLRMAMNLGANDYIIKPFEGNDLLSAVETRVKTNSNVSSPQAPVMSIPGNELLTIPTVAVSQNPLMQLMEACDVMEYSRKQVIYKEGSTPRFLYFIKKGKVRTYKSHEDGKDLVMGLYGEDDFIGYAPLLEGVFHIETAEATEDVELVLIPKTEFEKHIERYPEVMKHFIAILARNLMEKEDQLLSVAYSTLRKKVAGALVSLGKKYHKQREGSYTINMSRDELASIAGTATESLIRTLTEFKHEKLIDMNNGAISILNNQKLEYLIR